MKPMRIERRLRAELADHPQDVMIIVGAGVTLGALHGTTCDWVEAFLVQQGRCLGRSGPFIVAIE